MYKRYVRGSWRRNVGCHRSLVFVLVASHLSWLLVEYRYKWLEVEITPLELNCNPCLNWRLVFATLYVLTFSYWLLTATYYSTNPHRKHMTLEATSEIW